MTGTHRQRRSISPPAVRILATLAIALMLSAMVPHSAIAGDPAKVFRAGAYAMDITPETFPISVNGGMRDRQAKQAHDRLHARCLVLDDGRTRIAFAICDSCMIPREVFDAAKKMASAKTGIPTDHMLMSATHTHTAPTSAGVFQSDPDMRYRKFLARKIAAGIERAAAQLQPARIGWGVGKNPRQVHVRRWFMKPGTVLTDPFGRKTDKVKMNPPRGHATLDRPAGPIDPDVSLLAVETKDGRPLALLANYSLHYVGSVPGYSLSADYYGEFARQISKRLGVADSKTPEFVGIMSNGTSGNINNINFRLAHTPRRKPFEQIRIVAADVAGTAFAAYRKITFHDWVPIAMRETQIDLGVRRPSPADVAAAKVTLAKAGKPPYRTMAGVYARETLLMARYPRTVRVKLQAIRLGDLGIVSSPCETFTETGLAIKKQSPFKQTFTIELANGYNGYLPTPEQHGFGGYETWRARSSYLAVDAEPKIRRTLLRLLRDVAH